MMVEGPDVAPIGFGSRGRSRAHLVIPLTKATGSCGDCGNSGSPTWRSNCVTIFDLKRPGAGDSEFVECEDRPSQHLRAKRPRDCRFRCLPSLLREQPPIRPKLRCARIPQISVASEVCMW